MSLVSILARDPRHTLCTCNAAVFIRANANLFRVSTASIVRRRRRKKEEEDKKTISQ
tara:strand:+ start:587 stop:757 length:171 start_codon:yes stop_codon:yes gene_type:complete